jgi:hypothetical protein
MECPASDKARKVTEEALQRLSTTRLEVESGKNYLAAMSR